MRFSEVWERERKIREGLGTLWMKKRFWEICGEVDDPFVTYNKKEIQRRIIMLAKEYPFKIDDQLVLYIMKREFSSILLMEYLVLKKSKTEVIETFVESPDEENRLKVPPFVESETTSAPKVHTEEKIDTSRLKMRSFAKEEEDKRWSLQEEIAKPFDDALKYGFFKHDNVSCSISPCFKEYGDYKCTTILDVWPDIKKARNFRGPTHAGLSARTRLIIQENDMIERCLVSALGFLHFTISSEWIARSIHKMIKDGIDTWAPKLSVKRVIIHFVSRNLVKKMSMGHLRSIVIGEALARMLEYSRVEVIRRFHEGDDLDIKSKMMMTEFLIERFPVGELNDQAIGEPQVLYEESKKRFEKDAEFRERAQQVWDERHQLAWVKICKISLERYQNIYHRLGFHVKEEAKSLYDPYITQTLDLLRVKGLSVDGEGVFIEGRKLPLADLAALWHALDMVKADWIVHVTNLGKQDYIEMCINAAKRAGWIVTDKHSLSHVGFGLVEGDDLERFVNLDDLLDEAKSHCKAVLVGQGKAALELEHIAEALGYGAVKYADLKNNRLTNYKFSFDQMLDEEGNTCVYLQYTHARICSITNKSSKKINMLNNLKKKEVEKLILKNEEERELGLHLLRFTEVLGDVCKVAMPHILCDYLYCLCKKFDSLYPSVLEDVWSGEKIAEETSKLLLCEATRVVMKKCFHLLGITPIHKI